MKYMVHTWGGFYDNPQIKKMGYEEGYHYFNTEKERTKYINKLKKLSKKYDAKHLVYDCVEGEDVHKRTIVFLTFRYNGKLYKYVHDFGYGFCLEDAIWMFTDGNYSCDCNRSSFIRERYPDFPELDCGEKIEIYGLLVTKIDD